MGWEGRQGASYYYRSRRVGGRTVKTYFGRGEVARVAEQLDAADRSRRAAEGAALAAERARLAPAEAALDAACKLTAHATLLAAGFRWHNYSWRQVKAMLYEKAAPPAPAPTPQEIQDLVARARRGDAEVLPRLRAVLDAHPEVWQHCGDLARHAQGAWIALVAGADLAAQESLARKAAALAAELAGPAPTPMETLLVERVVAGWVQLHHADVAVARSWDLSLRQAAFVLKRQESAHRGYMAALGALATLRRLVPPALSIPFPDLRDVLGVAAGAGPKPMTPRVGGDGGDPHGDGVFLPFEPPRDEAPRAARPRRGRGKKSTAAS